MKRAETEAPFSPGPRVTDPTRGCLLAPRQPSPQRPHACLSPAQCLRGGAAGLSSLHRDSEMLRTRPQWGPKRMPQVGQLSFGTEPPHPSLNALGLRVDLGRVMASKEDPKAHQEPILLFPCNYVPLTLLFGCSLAAHHPIQRSPALFSHHCPVSSLPATLCFEPGSLLCLAFSFAFLVLWSRCLLASSRRLLFVD